MAIQWWGLNRGQTEFQATTGSSDLSKAVEVKVDLSAMSAASAGGKEEVLRMLKMLENVITKSNWPPA